MNNTYHIFGLHITSAIHLPAPFISNPPREFEQDVIIAYGKTPDALMNPQFKGVRFQAGPGEFLLRVDGVARYYVQDGRCITIMAETGAGVDDIIVFLMGPAMGALLNQRNILVLRASAIEVNGESVVFLGPSGIGKSTLAAGFHQRGYPFLTDDLCAISTDNGHLSVIPGFPRLKLWADVLKKLNIEKDTLKSIRSDKNLKKYFLPVDRIQNKPVPLKSVSVLEVTNTEKMEITALKGGNKIGPLINNTNKPGFPEGQGGKKDHFRQCVAVAAKADFYRIVRPNRGFLLNELMNLLEARF